MESPGILFVAAAWGVPLACLLGGAVAVVGIARRHRRVITALKKTGDE